MNARLVELDEEEYEDVINDCYGDIDVCGIFYPAGQVLKELDPIRFRVGMSEEPEKWQCAECGETYDSEEEGEDCCKEETQEMELK
jgi:hypothetical protein